MQKSAGNLTLVEKIGQLVLVGLDGTEAEGDIVELIQTYKIGGVVLKNKNFETILQAQSLINTLKSANLGNVVPLFIAISEETGRGNQLPKDLRNLPAMKFIAENADKTVIYETQDVMAGILRKLGINMNFAPLLDMGGMVEGIPLGDRCISLNNSTAVATTAVQTLNAYKANGVISVPKYFPGHTSTQGDRSNITIPYTKKSLTKMEQFDLVPFKYVIDEGVETMLIGNIHMARLNLFTPSTMSNRVITKLLKNRYKFEGISIADDLCSTCIKVQYGIKDAARKALMAGNDMIIIGEAAKAKAVLEDLEKQVQKGNIDEKTVELRTQKILDLKNKYNLNDEEVPNINLEEENEKIDRLLSKIRHLP